MRIPLPKTDLEIKYKQPWAVFSPEGERLSSTLQFLQTGTIFIFEGGQFIVRHAVHTLNCSGPAFASVTSVRFRRMLKSCAVQIRGIDGWGNITAETMSMIPLVFRVEEFLTDEECELIKELSLPHLKASGVSLMDKDKGKPATEWRTSSTYFLATSAHPRLKAIDKRCEDLVKVPASHQEEAQVLRYELSQKYDAHLDWFNPIHYQQSPQVLESIQHGFKNRMITVFWYMSDVEKGGHTAFPRAGGLPQPNDFTDCSTGLRVAPKKRMVIIFYRLKLSVQRLIR